MMRIILAGAAIAVGATVVLAQGDPIATRKQTMKGVGDATKIGSAMAKGEAPFDAAKAKEILLSESAWQQVRDLIAAEPVEPLDVKGFSEPIRSWKMTVRA